MTWLLVAQLVFGPKLSPADAAHVLATSPALANAANWPIIDRPSPRVLIIRSSPTAGPFGEFAPLSPPRRLDGTYLTDPPATGNPVYFPIISPWPVEHRRPGGRR
jgi:hypothetical protein